MKPKLIGIRLFNGLTFRTCPGERMYASEKEGSVTLTTRNYEKVWPISAVMVMYYDREET